mmetsp:Transcript_28103/g.57778  ORF Transcript_28103/g.57778 Transcript_28103/m.57778 type:complete len:413 (+) Transcript_28103:367-1605(+)
MAVFLTKNAKAEMRRRRRKKEMAETAKNGVNGHDEDEAKTTQQSHANAVDSRQPSSSSLGKKRSADQISSNGQCNQDEGGDSHNGGSNKVAKLDKHRSLMIIVPSELTSKESKKFRKDERRKARAQGISDDKITFVSKNRSINANNNSDTRKTNKNSTDPENEEHTENNNNINKPKKSFPRINDLLNQHAQQQQQLQLRKHRLSNSTSSNIPSALKQKYIAIDCEMVGIGPTSTKSALARASAVDYDGNILLDTFVRVPERVTDFRTSVSGVRPKDISVKNVNAMDPEEVRNKIGKLLLGKILVGHALKNDLDALMITHPRGDMRDTARYKPFMRATGRSGGKLRPRKLRDLVWEELGKRIQVEGESHSSVDDARASMELFRCVRERWEKELEGKGGGGRRRKTAKKKESIK